MSDYLHRQLVQWYSDQVCKNGEATKPVDLTLSVVKPLEANWLMGLYQYMKNNTSIIINGFKEAGIYTLIK